MSDDRRETVDEERRLVVTHELPNERRSRRTSRQIVPGSHIGRYEVLEELGAGTMGVVYAAHDPELDRKLALKLLKTRSENQAASRGRLQREAKALARLDHRNVVRVYDVGVHDERLFIAMEFVRGQTLRTWMEPDPRLRPWPEILRVLGQAGRGLAAAHGAGFVHRDFKPDNVMINESGVVKVMDFGLARAEMHEPPASDPGPGVRSSYDELEVLREFPTLTGLTETGTVMGTPGYMARELFQGLPADARSDQFAFCVTLYEALYGERPFPGRTMVQLLEAIGLGRVKPPSGEARVPGWLRKLVLRGLASDPVDRWPSMLNLLEELERGPQRWRRRWLGGVALGGVLLAGGASAVQAIQSARACAAAEHEVDALWNDNQRDRLRARFADSGVSYAEDSWRRVESALDGYAARWADLRRETCSAARSHTHSAAELELRSACLATRLQHLRATTELLAEADASVVARSVEMVGQLPRLEDCSDLETLARLQGSVPEGAATRELEQQLAQAQALQLAGKYDEGLALTAALIDAAAEHDAPQLRARARLQEGELLRRAGRYEQSEAALREAYELAAGLRMSAEAAEASARLVFIVGYQLARYDEGRAWAFHAKALARAAGTDEAQALYLNNIGALAYGQAEFAEAQRYWRRALELRERALGERHQDVGDSLNNLGVVAHALRDFEKAQAYHERALAIWTEAYGDSHPQTSYSLNHLGRAAREQGRYGEARSLHERALDIRERSLGPKHSLYADTLTDLGLVFAAEGKHEQALDHHERASAIFEQVLGSDHPRLATTLTASGRALLELQRPEQAVARLERALDIHSLNKGRQDRAALADTRFVLAQGLAALPRPALARARALAELSRKAYLDAGPVFASELAAVEAWLQATPDRNARRLRR